MNIFDSYLLFMVKRLVSVNGNNKLSRQKAYPKRGIGNGRESKDSVLWSIPV